MSKLILFDYFLTLQYIVFEANGLSFILENASQLENLNVKLNQFSMKSNSNFRQKVKTINAQKWDIYSVEKFSSEKISSLSSSYYSNIPKTPNFTANLTDQNELFNTVVENKYIRKWTLDQIVEIQIRINFKSNRYRKRFYVQNINMSSLMNIKAQKWAEDLATRRTIERCIDWSFGQNWYLGTKLYKLADYAVNKWYDEIRNFKENLNEEELSSLKGIG